MLMLGTTERRRPVALESDEDEDAQQERIRQRYLTRCAASTFSTSPSRQINLHSYATPSQSRYAETKIGGHALDHKRIIDDNAARVRRALLLASAAELMATPRRYEGARQSRSYEIAKHDVLVYSCVKIGGHALDHVPFVNRGLPSRPLLGYVPLLQRPFDPPSYASAAATLFPATVSLFDCSRCLRMRQSACVQLCCGHAVCASCASSRSIRHVDRGAVCYLDCSQCHEFVAIEAVRFPNYVLQLSRPPARTLRELAYMDSSTYVDHEPTLNPSELSAGWTYAGIVTALAFAAGRLVNWRSNSHITSPAPLALVADVKILNEDDDNRAQLVARLAALASMPGHSDSADDGLARWNKRVQGLQPPSKLLKYSFVRSLGVGKFADVMLVRNRKGQHVVLKESDKLQEAVNEIHLLSKIRSPQVVRIFQYFVEEIAHRPFVYIEMEFCDRGDLKTLLSSHVRCCFMSTSVHPSLTGVFVWQGPLDAAMFESVFRQLCMGLMEIHRHGIIHRDLKPGNVLLTVGGTCAAVWWLDLYLTHSLALDGRFGQDRRFWCLHVSRERSGDPPRSRNTRLYGTRSAALLPRRRRELWRHRRHLVAWCAGRGHANWGPRASRGHAPSRRHRRQPQRTRHHGQVP